MQELDRQALRAIPQEDIDFDEWLELNHDAIEARHEELCRLHPGATILKPGYHHTLDGKRHALAQFIIAS